MYVGGTAKQANVDLSFSDQFIAWFIAEFIVLDRMWSNIILIATLRAYRIPPFIS